MTNQFIEKYYKEKTYLEKSKIKAAWYISVICCILMLFMSFYTYKIEAYGTLSSAMLNVFSFLIAAILIQKGKNKIAVWCIVIPIYYTAWSNLFFGTMRTISEVDAIAYVIMHTFLLVLIASKHVFVFFSITNMFIGGFYVWLATTYQKSLPFWDTFNDMYVTLIFFACTGYSLMSIYENAMKENNEVVKNQKELNSKNERILKSITTMITGLSAVVDNVEHIINFLSDSTQNHAASLEEISASSEEVLSSSENIHTMTEKQNELIQVIKKDISEVLDIVTKAGNEMQSAYQIKEVLNKSIVLAEKDLAESQQIIETLTMSFSEVSKAAEVLEEIADDINLLSLNARIEAARSGLQGQGFAVVAEHIGLLANKTQGNAKEIGEVFKNNFKIIASVKEQLDILRKSLTSMISHTKDFGDKIDIVAQLAQQDYETTQGTNTRMETISEMSEIVNNSTSEQKLAMEESAKSISDINMGIQQIANEAERLSTLSKQLNTIVEELKNVSVEN